MALTEQNNPQLPWGTLATCWEYLAVSLRLPASELIDAVSSGEWGQAGLEVAGVLGLSDNPDIRGELLDPLATACNPEALGRDDCLRKLRAEYTRLFVYTPDAVVAPYESVWYAEEKGIQPMLYVSRTAMDVERFCKQCGLGRPGGTNEPLEHIATECELLEYLAALAGGLVELPDDGEAPQYPGGSPAGAYAEFLAKHGVWMPRFSAALLQETRLPYYRAVARLLESLVARAL